MSKRFAIFIATFLLTQVAIASHTSCGSVGGSWNYYLNGINSGQFHMTLTQNSKTNATGLGYVTSGACNGSIWSITATTDDTTGSVSFSGTFKSGPGGCGSSFSGTGQLGASCGTVVPTGGGWSGLSWDPNTVTLGLGFCQIPQGEQSTTFFGWASQGLANFLVGLNNPTGQPGYNWAGRSIEESLGTADGGCPNWSPATPPEVLLDDTGSFVDSMGWTDPNSYVNPTRRLHGAVPCTLLQPATTKIDCADATHAPGSFVAFQNNDTLSFGIGQSTITLARNGVGTRPMQEPFGKSTGQQFAPSLISTW